MATDFQERDAIRKAFAADLLLGRGIEIGAGNAPHPLPPGAECLHYDLRAPEDLAAWFGGADVVQPRPMGQAAGDFPEGADFVIAHNVLEHTPNPIGTLIEWNRLARLGGLVLISLPHFRFCADNRRRLPSLTHLVEDFLRGSDGRDFASREHTLSFTLGWAESYSASVGLSTIGDFSRRALDGLHLEDHDVHWHALDTELSLGIVAAAAHFDGAAIEIVRRMSPDAGETVGDILIAYRITARHARPKDVRDLLAAQARQRAALTKAVACVERLVPPPLPGRRVVPLERPFAEEGGHCFVAAIPPEFMTSVAAGTIMVEEEAGELGPAGSPHEAIRTEGGGRFSVWDGRVYFSSSDRTDCNENGRRYRLVATTA